MKRKSTIVKGLFQELSKIAEAVDYDPPIVRDNIVSWDGPYEWAILAAGGDSMFTYETECRTPMKIEAGLQKIFEYTRKHSHFLMIECMSGYSLGVYD